MLSNKEWINLLANEWNVSRTTARKMLHQLIIYKKRDECHKAQNELHVHSAYMAEILIERKR